MSRHALLTFLALALGACSAAAERSEQAEADRTVVTQGSRVEIATIQTQAARNTYRFTGEVRGAKDATLSSSTGGLIEGVNVTPGQEVSKGKTLVTIDYSIASARLQQVEARARLAEKEWERIQKLEDSVSASQRDRAETEALVADAALKEAKAMLRRASIVAPFSGTVADVDGEIGEVAAPGSPLVHLVSTDPVLVRISVSDRDIVSLKAGMNVIVSTPARPKPMAGTLTHIRAAANPKTRAFFADVTVANPDGMLLPGMIAKVAVDVDLGEAIIVPQDWLIMEGVQQGIYLHEDGIAKWRDVTIGAVLGNQVVVDGIMAGEEVIFNGHRTLLPNDPVIVSRTARCCDAGRPVYE